MGGDVFHKKKEKLIKKKLNTLQTVCSSAPWVRVSCFADEKKEMLQRFFHVLFSKALPPESQPLTFFCSTAKDGGRPTSALVLLQNKWTGEKHREVVEVSRTTGDMFTAHLFLMTANLLPCLIVTMRDYF